MWNIKRFHLSMVVKNLKCIRRYLIPFLMVGPTFFSHERTQRKMFIIRVPRWPQKAFLKYLLQLEYTKNIQTSSLERPTLVPLTHIGEEQECHWPRRCTAGVLAPISPPSLKYILKGCFGPFCFTHWRIYII